MEQEAESIEERPQDATEQIARWLKELSLAKKAQKDWEMDAKECNEIVRNEKRHQSGGKKEVFNILWSNVETKRPAIFNSLPRPDIRRRFRDKDPVGKAVSELMERATTVVIEPTEDVSKASVNDMLVPGRGNIRVRYRPVMDENGEVIDQKCEWEQVQWDDYLEGPGKTQAEKTWKGYRHRLTKEQVSQKFPDYVDHLDFSNVEQEDDEKREGDPEKTVFSRVPVWEIWDKETKKVLWVCESYTDSILGADDDPIGFKNFFPTPNPLMGVFSSTSTIPVTEYSMYGILAKELEIVTRRINKIVDAMRVRGIYDSTLGEIERLFESDDNEFIPAEDAARFVSEGGFEKAVYMLPVNQLAQVLIVLREHRRDLLQEIYEITGISDILRGDTNPNETLGAQKIKANFGSQRLQDQRDEIQRYFRDLVQMTVEVIGNHFSRETLSAMTGLSFPTQKQKQAAQQQMQMMQMMAQQTGQEPQPPPPQLIEVLKAPVTWEDIEEVIRSDLQTTYRIDIETDSTVQADQQKDQKAITELMRAIMEFFQAAAPAIQSGFLSLDLAKMMLLTAVRRYDLGRELEDSIEEIEMPEQQADPAQEAEQAKGEVEKAKAQAEMQKMQMEMQAEQESHRLEMEKLARQEQVDKAEHARKMQEMAANVQVNQSKSEVSNGRPQ